jgi:BirA family biotin operon repressor/biotin-[acetyl-CoA-carboxylase] ligase
MDRSWSSALRDPRVRAALAANDVVAEVVHRGSVGSTQDEALTLLRTGARRGLLLVADRQLAGRGRRGRNWDDAELVGASLALTLAIDTPMRGLTLVTHAVGLAVHDAVTGLGVAGLALKWPNDLVSTLAPAGSAGLLGSPNGPRRRKLAGILVERERVEGRDVLLVGVGVNVGTEGPPGVTHGEDGAARHPERIDLHELLRAAPDRDGSQGIDRAGLLAGLIAALQTRLGSLAGHRQSLLADYRERCETIGRDVDVELPDGDSLQGRATGVDDDGHLILDVDGAQHVVVAATVR